MILVPTKGHTHTQSELKLRCTLSVISCLQYTQNLPFVDLKWPVTFTENIGFSYSIRWIHKPSMTSSKPLDYHYWQDIQIMISDFEWPLTSTHFKVFVYWSRGFYILCKSCKAKGTFWLINPVHKIFRHWPLRPTTNDLWLSQSSLDVYSQCTFVTRSSADMVYIAGVHLLPAL